MNTFFCLFTVKTVGQNPLVTHRFTADPTARVFQNKLYVYPSTDIIPPEGVDAPRFCMPDYHVFSLEHGSTWKDHGRILDQNEVPWGEKDSYGMWAPDCIEKNGKYYFYFPAKPKDESAFRRIGVGKSDNPFGPFTWEEDYIEGVSGIDPGLFIDEDEQAYLYFGGGQDLYGAPLMETMTDLAANPVKIEGLPAGYKEGSFMFKRNDLYYFTFAHVFAQEGYTIGYATGSSPLGPFQYRGKIMDNISNGTNHHSIIAYEGRWILFYHWWDVSGYNKLRSMRADYMEFNDDGSIRKVKPTLRGIGVPTVGDTIQIDRYSEISNAEISFVGGNEPSGWMVCNTKPNGWVRFNAVDFKDGQAKSMKIRIASGQRIGHIEIHLDSQQGTEIAQFKVPSTRSWNNWQTISTPLKDLPTGIHDLFVVFKSEWGLEKIANVNWLIFEK